MPPCPQSPRHALSALVDALGLGDVSTSDRAATGPRRWPGSTACPASGPWTTKLIAMRALGDPDAFPASDLGVRRGAEPLGIPVDTWPPSTGTPTVATVAGLRRAVPVVGDRSPHQPMATGA